MFGIGNLIDLMKMGVEHPSALVDVSRVPLTTVEEHGDGVRIGAMARNSAVAGHPLIQERYPVLIEALLAGASPQIRNMATVGGNLLHRTRCFYFYDPSYRECNKGTPGSGCAALKGYNRIHSILGGSDHCIATHPSDMSVALAALEAKIQVKGSGGERSISIADFHGLPGTTPHIETVLKNDELITSVDLPAPVGRGSHYLKVRDRNSYAFALVSVACIVDLDDAKRIRKARIALGGVAPKPWRILEAEHFLAGKEANESTLRQVAYILVKGSQTHRYNAFKVELARRSVVRAAISIYFNGAPGYVYYYCSAATNPNCADDQINVLTPLPGGTIIAGPSRVTVENNDVPIATTTAFRAGFSPAFLVFDAVGHVAAQHADFSLLGPLSLYPGLTKPAKSGETIILYATGFALNGTAVEGSATQSGGIGRVDCWVSGMGATAVGAVVSPGLAQVNLTLPGKGLPSGDQPVVCRISTWTFPGAVIAIQES